MDTRLLYLTGKDVGTLTGRCGRNGQRELNKIRAYFKKEAHARITVIDYSIYSDMPLRMIFQLLLRTISETDMAELEKLKEQAVKEWEKKKREDGNEG